MKNSKFSWLKLLSAALLLSFVAVCTACKPEPDPEEEISIIGKWVGGQYGDTFVITETTYNNYYSSDGTPAGKKILYYKTNNVEIVTIDETSGYVYGKFCDEVYIGYGAEVGQWYALYYKNLTKDSVSISQAFGTKSACDTLEEAKGEFTVGNGYFENYSECVKEE